MEPAFAEKFKTRYEPIAVGSEHTSSEIIFRGFSLECLRFYDVMEFPSEGELM